MNVVEELAESLSNGQLILFIGAGVSMSLGLPSYSKLIHEIGEQLEYDGEVFHGLGDYLTLAEFYHLKKKGLKELQEYMRKKWEIPDTEIKLSKLHKAIVDLGKSIVYTTNFDGFLEKAYRLHNKPYKAISNVQDLVNIRSDATQIIKLHGDVNTPSKMVFTETSYFERLSFESPLDIKLRSDALGKSILFMGYSLSDINIRYLIYRLNKQWESEDSRSFQPKSYIYIGRPNPVQEEVLQSRGIIPVIAETDDQTESLVEFLSKIKDSATAKYK